jgi:predicted esterase
MTPREGGAPPHRAQAALLLLHGRGGSASDMLRLAEALALPELHCRAPEAPTRSWYPHSFLAPLAANEPALSQALGLVDAALNGLAADGFPAERVVILGFSQGACLACEYVARHARRYGGLVALSGGLIGPPGTPRAYPGGLAGTPAFLGCSDVDPHIPLARVRETTQVLLALGAAVTERIYPGFGHGINEDEIREVRILLTGLTAS